jgi:hypothetical protein
MEFGIFNLMGSRDPEKQTAEVFAEGGPVSLIGINAVPARESSDCLL